MEQRLGHPHIHGLPGQGRSASGLGPRIRGIGWSSKKDRAVLADARTSRYDALLTNDASQLDDPDETDRPNPTARVPE
jgi:hypothetical protein